MCAITYINPLNAELNLIRHLLALVGARHIVHVSRIRVKPFNASIFTKLMTVPAITWRIAVKNFTQIDQEIWKVQLEIHLHSPVKRGFH